MYIYIKYTYIYILVYKYIIHIYRYIMHIYTYLYIHVYIYTTLLNIPRPTCYTNIDLQHTLLNIHIKYIYTSATHTPQYSYIYRW